MFDFATQKYYKPLKYVLYITNTWFVISILLLYIAFYAAFKERERKGKSFWFGFWILAFEVIVYVIVCLRIKVPSCYTSSVLAFLFGIVWYKKEKSILSWITPRYTMCLFASVFLALFSFGSRLVLAYKGWNDEIFQCVLRNIVCLFFVLAVLIVLRKIAFHGKVVSLLGKISFELYIAHSMVLEVLSPIMKTSVGYSSLVILISLFLALITQKEADYLMEKVRQKKHWKSR
jgi:peptidoglycan/LPS O-acetylase OafA/YrhL